MFCYEGRISMWSFLITLGTVLTLMIPRLIFDVMSDQRASILWSPLFYYTLINMILRFSFTGNNYQVAVRAAFLGFIFAISLLLTIFSSTKWKPFGIYGMFMAAFHFSEFLAIAWCNPSSLSIDSYILNHSTHYALAAVVSWIEFYLEALLFPGMKQWYTFWIFGAIICLIGEILRKLAMITASTNFSHMVQYVKAKEHKLVTHGIYRIMRHPSYVGWFWWSIGTQIILLNPLCIVLYAIVSWRFFRERIFIEEITLIQFFGTDYCRYQERVPCGLPLISGYKNKSK